MAFRISKAVFTNIENLGLTLEAFVQEKRDEYDERSEAWQESDRAEDTSAWLDQLEELVEALQAATASPRLVTTERPGLLAGAFSA